LKYIVYLASTMQPRYQERTAALLLAILEELGAASNTSCNDGAALRRAVPLQISNALAYVEEHLYESISIQQLAVWTGWSHEHFTRIFVQSQGLSPKQYILQRRVERACEMLRFQNMSIKEIAYKVGFQSEQYFSRAFVKHTGVTATKYKERYADPRLLNLHLAPVSEVTAPYPLNRMFGPAYP
jgi:AraC family transcriptional regulator